MQTNQPQPESDDSASMFEQAPEADPSQARIRRTRIEKLVDSIQNLNIGELQTFALELTTTNQPLAAFLHAYLQGELMRQQSPATKLRPVNGAAPN